MTYTLQQLIQKDQKLGRAIFDRGNREKYGVCCGNCRYWELLKKSKTRVTCRRRASGLPVWTGEMCEELWVSYKPNHWCGDFERDTTTKENTQ